MFFARSLRFKLYGGLAASACMLLALTGVALVTLTESGRAIDDLHARVALLPNRADLDRSARNLFAHLLWHDRPTTAAGFAEARTRTLALLDAVEGHRVQMIRDFDAAPAGSDQRAQWPVVSGQLSSLGRRMNRMAQQTAGLLAPDLRAAEHAHDQLARMASKLEEDVLKLPDPWAGLNRSIAHSQKSHRRLYLWVFGLGTLVVLGAGALVFYGFRRIGLPMRDIHRGARQIAGGDWEHRVRVKREDEIGELARAVNHMADRFSEIKGDLDARVHQQAGQLVRSERLASIGTLSSGLGARDQQPALGDRHGRPEPHRPQSDALLAGATEKDRTLAERYLDMIARETARCTGITRKLLTFAKGDGGRVEPHNVRTLVGEVLEMVRPMSRYADRPVLFDPGPAGRGADCLLSRKRPGDQAGPAEPRAQRPRGHARRRPRHDRREAGGGRRGAGRHGHRPGDERGGEGAPVRAVLHPPRRRVRHGPGPLHDAPDRRRPRRHDRGRQRRGGRGQHLPRPPPPPPRTGRRRPAPAAGGVRGG